MLSLDAVTRTYLGPPPVHALHAVDLTIETGEYCAITGPSGAGKSTLLNILGMLDRPTSGSYSVAGQTTGDLPERKIDRLRARTFGFVFQSSHMLGHWSVAANVALALRSLDVPRSERRDLVRSALDEVGLLSRAGGLARDLSGGERQRAAIARATCARPAVLLADEPTGNLDSGSSGRVMDLLDAIHARGVTVVVITHDDTVAARAGRQVVVSDGTVAA